MTTMAEADLQMTDLYALKQEQPMRITHEDELHGEECKKKKLKVPRRILHFSDGTMEEYSTDEEDETDNRSHTLALVDPKSLRWGPWMYYWMLYTGTSALSACDYVGEGLANFLGITSPKYQYEIDEYKRSEEEEKAEREEEAAEMAGWITTEAASIDDDTQPKIDVSPAIQQPPSPSHVKNQAFMSQDIPHKEDQAPQRCAAHDLSPCERF